MDEISAAENLYFVNIAVCCETVSDMLQIFPIKINEEVKISDIRGMFSGQICLMNIERTCSSPAS